MKHKDFILQQERQKYFNRISEDGVDPESTLPAHKQKVIHQELLISEKYQEFVKGGGEGWIYLITQIAELQVSINELKENMERIENRLYNIDLIT